jgi:hypothetical protein
LGSETIALLVDAHACFDHGLARPAIALSALRSSMPSRTSRKRLSLHISFWPQFLRVQHGASPPSEQRSTNASRALQTSNTAPLREPHAISLMNSGDDETMLHIRRRDTASTTDRRSRNCSSRLGAICRTFGPCASDYLAGFRRFDC